MLEPALGLRTQRGRSRIKENCPAPLVENTGSFGISSSNIEVIRLAHLESSKSWVCALNVGEFNFQVPEVKNFEALLETGFTQIFAELVNGKNWVERQAVSHIYILFIISID